MREIRRRTRVVGNFPDRQSALMLVAARLRYVASTRWGSRRYLDMNRFREFCQEERVLEGMQSLRAASLPQEKMRQPQPPLPIPKPNVRNLTDTTCPADYDRGLETKKDQIRAVSLLVRAPGGDPEMDSHRSVSCAKYLLRPLPPYLVSVRASHRVARARGGPRRLGRYRSGGSGQELDCRSRAALPQEGSPKGEDTQGAAR